VDTLIFLVFHSLLSLFRSLPFRPKLYVTAVCAAMHIYGKDQQAFHLQRTETERWWSRLNVLIVIVQLACFLSAIIRTSTNANNSMSNSFFAISPLQLKAPYLREGCEYNVSRTHAFFRNVTFTMNPGNVGYFVSRGVLNIRYLMVITAVHVVVSMLNRLWFETNTHEIRYHFVVFRKDMVTTWEVLLMALGMVMTWGVTKENQIMTDYLTACGSGAGGAYYNSVQPYTELIVSYIVSIAITVINALFAIWNLSKENPRDAMLKEDKKRREEWEAAMREYYGLPDPAAGGSSADEGDHHHNDTARSAASLPGNPQPQVTYASNRAATVDLNGPPAQAGPDLSASARNASPRPRQHHHHHYHQAIRKGISKPFTALSNSLRGRTKPGDPVVAAQHQQHHHHSTSPHHGGQTGADMQPQPSQAQMPLFASYSAPQLQKQQQQQYNVMQPTQEPPHVGPSVSRPLTPLLNEEYEKEEEMMVPAPSGGRSPMAPQDRRGPNVMNAATGNGSNPQPQPVSSSHSGRYDLHEVDYDDEQYDSVDVDVTNSSPRGPASSSAAGNNTNSNNGNGSGRRPAAAGSDASTALLNARLSAAPPPPPSVYSGDRRQQPQRAQGARGQMLAPPSPLQGGGAETTDDTVVQ
jgi:hypothetical protein